MSEEDDPRAIVLVLLTRLSAILREEDDLFGNGLASNETYFARTFDRYRAQIEAGDSAASVDLLSMLEAHGNGSYSDFLFGEHVAELSASIVESVRELVSEGHLDRNPLD